MESDAFSEYRREGFAVGSENYNSYLQGGLASLRGEPRRLERAHTAL